MAATKIKSRQQVYLEEVVRTEDCACGCGGTVEVKRYQTFPSYLRRRKYVGRFLPGHNIIFDHEARRAASEYPSGSLARAFRGGRVRRGKYIGVLSNDTGGYDLEHRIAVEQELGRKLLSTEIVHHRNENTVDNRYENLKVVTRAKHASIHLSDRKRAEDGRFLPNGNG